MALLGHEHPDHASVQMNPITASVPPMPVHHPDPRPPSPRRRLLGPLSSVALAAVLASCGSVVDAPLQDEAVCVGEDCACPSATGDCDGLEATGCEVDLLQDPDHCGACGNSCGEGRCAGGRCECNEGFADCDGLAETGCEAELAWDSSHCGSCGRDCSGGPCVLGQCQPVDLDSPTSQSSDLTPLGDRLFWHGAEDLVSLPVDAVTPATIFQAASCPYYRSMVADSDSLYWGCDTVGIMAANAAGDPATVLVPGAEVWSSDGTGQRSIAVGPTWLFWTELEGDSFTIYRAPKHGAGPIEVLVPHAGHQLLLTEQYLYYRSWSDAQLWRAPIDGSPSELFDEAPDMRGIAAEFDGAIYWTTWHGSVWKKGEASSSAVLVAAELPFTPTALAIDESGIYATDYYNGLVGRIDPATGAGVILAASQPAASFPLLGPGHLYWTAFGSVMRLVK